MESIVRVSPSPSGFSSSAAGSSLVVESVAVAGFASSFAGASAGGASGAVVGADAGADSAEPPPQAARKGTAASASATGRRADLIPSMLAEGAALYRVRDHGPCRRARSAVLDRLAAQHPRKG